MKTIRILFLVFLLFPFRAASYPAMEPSLFLCIQNSPLFLKSLSHPWITAHRGASTSAPENTLPALQAAIDAQADFVEIDVRETADGIPVLCHDSLLKRTSGESGSLQDYTYAELSVFDFGGWFSDSYKNVPIPTLEQALETCKGHIRMNIELKSGETLTETVLELLELHDMENQVVLSSTKLPYLKEAKEKKPEIPAGYIASSPCPWLLEEEIIDFFSVSSAWVTEDFVTQAHRLGKEVHIWTVDTSEALLAADALGVDNVITDCPKLAKTLLR